MQSFQSEDFYSTHFNFTYDHIMSQKIWFFCWKLIQSGMFIDRFGWNMTDHVLLILFPSLWICYKEYYLWKFNEIVPVFLSKKFGNEEHFVLVTNLSRFASYGLSKWSIIDKRSLYRILVKKSMHNYPTLWRECPIFILFQFITSLFILNIWQMFIFAIMLLNIRSIFFLRHHYHLGIIWVEHQDTWIPNTTEIVNLYKYSLTHDICQEIINNCKVTQNSKQTSPLILETTTIKYKLLTKRLPKELCDLIMTFYNLENFTIKIV
jgi:hypothetical protein